MDDMTSRGRAARSRTRSRTPCRVIQDRRQTTTVARAGGDEACDRALERVQAAKSLIVDCTADEDVESDQELS